MINDALKDAKSRMASAVSVLEDDLAGIRTGRATPALVDKLQVEYYGMPTPLMQLATISVPEPRQLLIRPFDAGSVNDVIKAIQSSDLGLTPNSDGKQIRLNLPPLTEERRRDLAKVVSSRVEDAKVAVRNVRRDVIKDLREFENEKMITEDDLKHGEDEVQKLTDEFTEKIDKIGDKKNDEIMEV